MRVVVLETVLANPPPTVGTMSGAQNATSLFWRCSMKETGVDAGEPIVGRITGVGVAHHEKLTGYWSVVEK
jgi:hypothetical protein